jgi:23S rRNA (uracil1939-C5)-methyltransferase
MPTGSSCEVRVEALSHEGRGIAHVGGKATFIDGALPGERVRFRYTRRRGRFDEGVAIEILESASARVEPRCPHFGLCGGCSLQHYASIAQIQHKQAVLLEQLQHIGGVRPVSILPPLTGPVWDYRHKARLTVRYVEKKAKLLIGFKEKGGRRVADLSRCEVLHPSVGQKLTELRVLLGKLSLYKQIPQIEVAVGEDSTALVIRHLAPLSDHDQEQLKRYAELHRMSIYLQAGGPETVELLWPKDARPLHYRLPAEDIEIYFEPTAFTQVNPAINQALIGWVVELLNPKPDERVLDLFCGLGNFTLPIARHAGWVLGIEGQASLVERARRNAEYNKINNVDFEVMDLADENLEAAFIPSYFDKVLLDPPRTGAREIIERLEFKGVKRLVYVSCNPATLARDARILMYARGLLLAAAGVLDMFPHTTHVESIALFLRNPP